MLKNDYIHPVSKNNGGKKKTQTLVLPPKAEAALRAAKDSRSCPELLVRFSHHIWWAILQAPYSPFLSSALSPTALGGHLHNRMFLATVVQPLHGLDFESGISSHWLTAWVCFSKWLYHNYKIEWVNLLNGGLMSVCW